MTTYAIGIDPSLTGTAIAGIAITETIHAGTGDQRLIAIYDAVRQATPPYGANQWLAIVEDLPYHAKSAGATGLAHGVVRLALQQANVPYMLIPPATLKAYATGKGNATKADMRMAWFKRTGEDIRDDNQVDALWLRDIGRHAAGDSLALQLPRAQHERLLKLEWPADIAARLLAPYETPVKEAV
jgi:Holliday junction resolvasome RuvABC endonuclease subunit